MGIGENDSNGAVGARVAHIEILGIVISVVATDIVLSYFKENRKTIERLIGTVL